MRRKFSLPTVYLLLTALLIGGWSTIPSVINTASAQQQESQTEQLQKPQRISAQAEQQIQSLLAGKETQAKHLRKIDSNLFYTYKQSLGQEVADNVSRLETGLETNEKGFIDINIDCVPNEELTDIIEQSGGEVTYASKQLRRVKASVHLSIVPELAGLENVSSISPAIQEATTHRAESNNKLNKALNFNFEKQNFLPSLAPRPSLEERSARVRAQLKEQLSSSALAKRGRDSEDGDVTTNIGAVTSPGDVAHRAREGRTRFGVNGGAIRIGVISDSERFKEQSQASGDLPPECTDPTGPKTTPCTFTLPGQSGRPGSGEGTAMMELIHDLAPGAQLYFATAFISDASFADNIRRLRFEYDCDIIVDDIIYFVESPFQDDIIAAAVNDVTEDGALYFSSAGNEGNFNDGTSGTWEGDFRNGGTLATLPNSSGYRVHNFGDGVVSNRIEASAAPILLHWSDPIGASSNDYDLFQLDANLNTVIAASTNVQDGDDRPFERINVSAAGRRLVIARKDGAEVRALNLIVFRGQLGISTPGTTRGHNSAREAFGVAAVNVTEAGGGAFVRGPETQVETFSADGPRRVFYNDDGTPITPGRVTFRSGGGELRQKPDIAAADGTATTVPGFIPFFGTSAAAPHAAAIAALVKSSNSSLEDDVVRFILERTAIDIEARGVDRDSGVGIVDAFEALRFSGARPQPFLELGNVTTTPVGGDGDGFIEPGEGGQIRVQLRNIGGAAARRVRATLTTSTPGVTVTTPNSEYPSLAPSEAAENDPPFAFTLSNSAICGVQVNFTLEVEYRDREPQTFNFSVQTGQPGSSATTVSYTGPVVPIPDAVPTGVNVPINLSGFSGGISDLNFRIDGSDCSAAIGATGVGIDHTWVGDLVITLRAPSGRTVTLINQADGSGNNFCQTLLDDSATTSIQSIISTGTPPLGPPYTGTFRPFSPLSAFNGEDPNGTWTLNVSDLFLTDTGNVRAFSLIVTTFECSSDSSGALADVENRGDQR